jgi:hypothetical protein
MNLLLKNLIFITKLQKIIASKYTMILFKIVLYIELECFMDLHEP